MKHYRDYMDRQQVSPALHGRLSRLEQKPIPKGGRGKGLRAAALAACCTLIVGAGIWQASGTARTHAPSGLDAADSVQPVQPPSTDGTGEASGSDFHGFLANSGENRDITSFYDIPAIAYPDLTGLSADSEASIATPDGTFIVDLTKEQVCLLLWGGQDGGTADNVPWALFWDGYTIAGEAWYDGYGALWQVTLWGEHPEGGQFSIILAPGHLPPACTAADGAETAQIDGTEVETWSRSYDCNGDGRKESVYESAFVSNGVGIRAKFVLPEDSGEESGLHSTLFIRWACAQPGLTLDHLLQVENAPAFRSAEFQTLAQAREETAFSPYLPQSDPAGYGDFFGSLIWQEGIQNRLFVRWSRGYDDIAVFVELPEGGPATATVDADAPETYDLRLYSTPWCDSVPSEYLNTVSFPAFRAEDMSRDIIAAREQEKDTGGSRFSFQVVHPDGTLVEYDCSGLTVDQMWAMVEATLF